MATHKDFLTTCGKCRRYTSKKYARANRGLCKSCATGQTTDEYHGPKCPDCGGPISAYKLRQGYHCDACTRQTDPIGYYNETRGFYD